MVGVTSLLTSQKATPSNPHQVKGNDLLADGRVMPGYFQQRKDLLIPQFPHVTICSNWTYSFQRIEVEFKQIKPGKPTALVGTAAD